MKTLVPRFKRLIGRESGVPIAYRLVAEPVDLGAELERMRREDDEAMRSMLKGDYEAVGRWQFGGTLEEALAELQPPVAGESRGDQFSRLLAIRDTLAVFAPNTPIIHVDDPTELWPQIERGVCLAAPDPEDRAAILDLIRPRPRLVMQAESYPQADRQDETNPWIRMEWAFQQSLRGAAKWLLVYIAFRGDCWASQERIAAEIGVTARTVRSATRELLKGGYIARLTSTKGRRMTLYRVKLHRKPFPLATGNHFRSQPETISAKQEVNKEIEHHPPRSAPRHERGGGGDLAPDVPPEGESPTLYRRFLAYWRRDGKHPRSWRAAWETYKRNNRQPPTRAEMEAREGSLPKCRTCGARDRRNEGLTDGQCRECAGRRRQGLAGYD